jgi:hypothetical protein
MDDFAGYAVLLPSDIKIIERMRERAMSYELRCFLLGEFGEGGWRDTYVRWADEAYRECIEKQGGCRGCGECAMSHPYLGTSLLDLLQEVLDDDARGLIDYSTGKRIEPKPIELPF